MRGALAPKERVAIVHAVQSVFIRAEKLHELVSPAYLGLGFRPPSMGVLSRDLSEQIEGTIIQQCDTFSRGDGHADLKRKNERWEVKIKSGTGLTINQSSTIAGETYIVANYCNAATLVSVWLLWYARDEMFTLRRANSNARALLMRVASTSMEQLYP